MKSVLNVLRIVIKYSAYVLLIVEVFEFAISKIEALNKKIEEKKPLAGGEITQ